MKYSTLNTAILLTLFASFTASSTPQNELFTQWLPSTDIEDGELQLNNRVSAGYRTTINFSDLNQTLLEATTPLVVSLPLPNGELVNFELSPSLTMSSELAARYPSIRTFIGVQIDNPKNKGRFDVTPHGFHSFFRFNEQDVYIEPRYIGNSQEYVSYFKKDALALTDGSINKRMPPIKRHRHIMPVKQNNRRKRAASSLRTYRIAVAADAEFTAFHGGTKELGLAAVVTMINRINEVYERDLAIKLELVADNDKIIYTDAATDPYANDDTDIDKNTGVLDKEIGSGNYDIGHVVGTGGGGVAGFGVVCDSISKGDGLTGSDQPTGDAFFIDYVAHEIGHQFMADHTFNGNNGSCEENREQLSSYEPGSGSTIMGYAGLCDNQNLQDNSDPFFHAHSIAQINQFVTNGGGSQCGTVTNLNNSVPVVDAGKDYTIPANTAFKLTGSATDINQDSLSYSWEQYDLGPMSNGASEQVDDGKRPLFRAWSPTTVPMRTFPKLSAILSNKLDIGEVYPTTARKLNFRLLVRDGKGGVSFDAMTIDVIKADDKFAVIAPTSDSQWNSSEQLVRWNVAQTNQSPISCSAVNIEMSLDGGLSFAHTLATEVPNNGRFTATIPQLQSDKARIKVSCHNNIFFAINNADFSVGHNASTLNILGLKTAITTNEDEVFALTSSMFDYQTIQADKIEVLAGDNYRVVDGKVIPKLHFNGELLIGLVGTKGSVQSQKVTIKVSILAVNDDPIAINDTAEVAAGSTSNSIDVLINDSDVDKGDSLSLSNVQYTGSGTVSIENNRITYSPNQGFVGTEDVNYTVSDSNGGIANASLHITVKDSTKPTPTVTTPAEKKGGALSWWELMILATMITTITRHRRS